MAEKTGVLIVGFGGPDSLDAVGPFMENLMGRAPSEELLGEVRARYLAIGGSSPLPEIAQGFAEGLAARLVELERSMPIAVGMRYWHPFIADSMEQLKSAGCDRIIVVSLSPFESKVAQQAYRDAIESAASEKELEVVYAPLISTFPEFAHYLASGMSAAITDIEPAEGAIVAFTAHSLPVSELEEEGDPYVEGIRGIAETVATLAGMEAGSDDAGATMFRDFSAFGSAAPPRAWYLVYQSKGRKPGEWLGPDLQELIEAAADSEVKALVVVPVGFVTDHMETLYDLDIVAADEALSRDLEFVRAPVPNDDHSIVTALADTIVGLL